MQLSAATKLRKEWGKKECDHPQLDKEYFNSMSTGDYVCIQCGRAFDSEDRQSFKTDKKSKDKSK